GEMGSTTAGQRQSTTIRTDPSRRCIDLVPWTLAPELSGRASGWVGVVYLDQRRRVFDVVQRGPRTIHANHPSEQWSRARDSLSECIRRATESSRPPPRSRRPVPPLARDFMVSPVVSFSPKDPLRKA